jgi:formate hydrogenlyase subunit 4
MVHEGPLLEYAGRDLAYLHWSAAARHWVVIVLAIQLVVPMPSSAGLPIASLVAATLLACVALALVESLVAKLRILRVPALLGAGMAICLVGLATQIAAGTP